MSAEPNQVSFNHVEIDLLQAGNSDHYKQVSNKLDIARRAVKVCETKCRKTPEIARCVGFGQAEKQIGEALKQLGVHRSQYVLSTKLFRDTAALKPNRHGLGRKHLIEGMKKSLRNLGTSYVDVVFAHRPDREVPMEEVCRGFDWIIRHNLARYWGTSEWDASEIAEARAICQKFGLYEPAFEQPQYNIFAREKFEIEYKRLFKLTKMGSTIWSPLAGGILTGKYNAGLPEGSRFDRFGQTKAIFERYFAESKKEATLKKLNEFTAYADSLGITTAQLAMAWCLYNPDVSTAITGASNPNQLVDTVKAVDFLDKYTPEIDKKIEQIFQSEPKGTLNRRTMQPEVSRRLDRS